MIRKGDGNNTFTCTCLRETSINEVNGQVVKVNVTRSKSTRSHYNLCLVAQRIRYRHRLLWWPFAFLLEFDELDATVQLWLNLISSVYLVYLLFCIPYAFVHGFPVNLSWSYFGSTRLRLAETQYFFRIQG
ncbi:hypothetical protein K503DRAFT_56422 [Rhizopogon vinicolor AM-OR11-026]|uniref:Uncharacterized protein n=1 Tax=Rhizopogon vinicolor AM-OR11-026 TaxID=1314800 RepID=A0A1B7MGJ6_9AGAM|nr:hypothetical protein K503DRAFT_56422 [Rhizopogon vinicolor AM-OR11-026]